MPGRRADTDSEEGNAKEESREGEDEEGEANEHHREDCEDEKGKAHEIDEEDEKCDMTYNATCGGCDKVCPWLQSTRMHC